MYNKTLDLTGGIVMAVAPVARLKKSELVWLSNHTCKHGHNYLNHYNCYLNEMPDDSPLNHRIGFFDIETYGFKASSGILFGYCIKELDSDKIHEAWLEPSDRKNGIVPDERVSRKMVEDLRKFDLIVTYYGTRMDLPFARTKALMHGIDFPEYGELTHLDLYYLIRNKFSLHRNSLEVACSTLLGKTNKTHFDVKLWNKALFGDQKVMKMIAEHCRYDVIDTEALYKKAIPFRRRLDQSI